LEDLFILFGRIEWIGSAVRLSVGNVPLSSSVREWPRLRWLAGWVGLGSGFISGGDAGTGMASMV
jgi:hypothetical protein